VWSNPASVSSSDSADLPVDAPAHRVGGLPVREVLGKLENGHQGQPPGRFGGPTSRRKQVREIGVLVDGSEVIPHPGVRGAGRKRGAGDPSRFFGDGLWRVRAE